MESTIDFDNLHLTTKYLIQAWTELANHFTQNPEKLARNQFCYWQDYMSLCQDLTSISFTETAADKRFQNQQWDENVFFNFIKKSYFLLSQHLEQLINDMADQVDNKTSQKLRFYIRQCLDAFSPSNFANTNPDILFTTAETHGENLLNGIKQFLDDINQGNGHLNIKMTDSDAFKLGENIACTRGKVVYQNDLMQLIKYDSNTKTLFEIPLLIIPPWINKYYILDLQSENSFVKWLVDQGITVFLISWVNPSEKHRQKEFSDYMLEGPIAALDVIENITGNNKTNILGYCVGGTLLACLLAYFADKREDRILSATFLTTLIDFSEPGELGCFIDEKQISMLEEYMKKRGFIDGIVMASVFNALRANDLVWSSYVNNYLKGNKPKPFDLLFWNSDSTNIPEKVHSFYLRNMYLENNLIKANQLNLSETSIDLTKIKIPSYFLAAHDDHIVPWQSAYKGAYLFSGPTEFVLTGSGHVAGVINPPHKNKYGYWTNTQIEKNSNLFLKNAEHHDGSWWTHWLQWLKQYSGKEDSAENIKFNYQEILEDAPGSYVKLNCHHHRIIFDTHMSQEHRK